MTIYHRLKVWAIKVYRLVRFGFKFVKPRGLMVIWTQPVLKGCDYCGFKDKCVTLECDWEVVATICNNCLDEAKAVIGGTPKTEPFVKPDHRGVIM